MACRDHRSTMDENNHHLKIIRHPVLHTKLSTWFDLRVFYVRVTNFEVDDSTPKNLTLIHLPLGPDTIFEVNGRRSSSLSEHVSTQLRRDRFDKNSGEVTFVNTDGMRITGSMLFEVYDGDDLLLSGVLELCKGNGFVGEEAKGLGKKWRIRCHSHITSATRMAKGKLHENPKMPLPAVEVYVAGCFSGIPIILSKALHPFYGANDSTTRMEKDPAPNFTWIARCGNHKLEGDMDEENLYARSDYMEDELSWFNAGVRVGFGIGLGICVGVGLGVGLLVRSHRSASRNFWKQLI